MLPQEITVDTSVSNQETVGSKVVITPGTGILVEVESNLGAKFEREVHEV